MKKISFLLFALLLLTLMACEHHHTNPPDKGRMPVEINLEPAVAHGFNVTQVEVTITRGDFSDQMDLPITGNTASGTFEDLEIGSYAIDVGVFEDSTLIAAGSGTGTVRPGETTTVYITLHFVPGGLEVVVNWGLPYEESRRVLLVGNSHTYFNNGVDTHLQLLMNAIHPEWNVVVEDRTVGGYTLEQHYNDANTLNAIRTGNWDLVILQEQSSRPMNDPDLFYQYSILLNDVINQAGALTGFYMTWAWKNNPEMYVPIRDAYYYIGAYLDAPVVPAGVAYHNALDDSLAFNLYAPDNYHPSLYGTYLVACLMLAEIWNVNPVGNSYYPAGIAATEAAYLQNLAWTTVQQENAKQKAWPKPLPPLLPEITAPREPDPLPWLERAI